MFDNIEVTHESASFSLLWGRAENRNITSLELFLNGTLVKSLNSSATSVNELKGNRTYEIKARYKDEANQDKMSSFGFTTEPFIYFGEYPQTIKTDSVTVSATTDSRGYYLGSDSAYYAKVAATPYNSGYTFSTGTPVTSGTEYYFKVEPIKWRILSEISGESLLLCESILANMAFNSENSSNYSISEVRAWLNAEFYNKAFTTSQKTSILTTEVDNSINSNRPELYTSDYCDNTNDKIFLPCYQELVNANYGFSNSSNFSATRERLASDYSRATGINMSTDNSYYGNGVWWSRSPMAYYARFIDYNGAIIASGGYTPNICHGVVPAMKINLSGAN